MYKIVSSLPMVITNIHHFQQEVAQNIDLQGRLAYARAWYASRANDGSWIFGNSKFITYTFNDRPLTGAEYIEDSEELDGRKTEAQLHQWFDVVEPNTALYQKLRKELFDFLAKYGKTPSTAVRINILKAQFNDYPDDEIELRDPNDALVDLIVTVARALPAAHRERLQARLR